MKTDKILEIINKLKKFGKDRFTGEIVLRVIFNQGGIRDYKFAREEDV